MAKKALTTDQVKNRLRIKYGGDGQIFLEEVRNSTGFVTGVTTADGLLFNLWPCKGLEIEGFEIKASRGDWLRELKVPRKAESISQYCDRWWLVVGDAAIIDLAELPPTWGLVIPYGKGLRIKKAASLQETGPIDRSFLMSIIRSLYRKNPEAKALREEYERGFKEGKKKGIEITEEQAGKTGELIKQVRLFEEASGLDIQREWNCKALGEAVAVVRDEENLQYLIDRLKSIKREYVRLVEAAEKGIKNLNTYQKEMKRISDGESPRGKVNSRTAEQ